MTANLANIQSELINMALEIKNDDTLDINSINSQTSLLDKGIGFDSIDLLEFIVKIEKKYGFKITNNEETKKNLINIESLSLAIQNYLQNNLHLQAKSEHRI